MFSKSGRKVKQCEKTKRQGRGVRPSWAGGRDVQMLQRSSEAENVLPRLPPEPDYSGASSSGSAQSWFCRDQLLPLLSWWSGVSSAPTQRGLKTSLCVLKLNVNFRKMSHIHFGERLCLEYKVPTLLHQWYLSGWCAKNRVFMEESFCTAGIGHILSVKQCGCHLAWSSVDVAVS